MEIARIGGILASAAWIHSNSLAKVVSRKIIFSGINLSMSIWNYNESDRQKTFCPMASPAYPIVSHHYYDSEIMWHYYLGQLAEGRLRSASLLPAWSSLDSCLNLREKLIDFVRCLNYRGRFTILFPNSISHRSSSDLCNWLKKVIYSYFDSWGFARKARSARKVLDLHVKWWIWSVHWIYSRWIIKSNFEKFSYMFRKLVIAFLKN